MTGARRRQRAPQPGGAGAQELDEELERLRAAIAALQAQLEQERKLNAFRLELLESRAQDQEARLRAATEGVAQFRLLLGLSGGGSLVMALAALIRAFLGDV